MKKTPFVTLDKAKEIAAQYPTPFHLYDEAGIRANARALKAAFSWNPGYREYFAVKATPNPYILKVLQCTGVGTNTGFVIQMEGGGILGGDLLGLLQRHKRCLLHNRSSFS